MKIFIHYIYGDDKEEKETQFVIETLIGHGYDGDDIYTIPVESHED